MTKPTNLEHADKSSYDMKSFSKVITRTLDRNNQAERGNGRTMNGLLTGIIVIGATLLPFEIRYWMDHPNSDLALLLTFILFSIVVIAIALIQERTKKD